MKRPLSHPSSFCFHWFLALFVLIGFYQTVLCQQPTNPNSSSRNSNSVSHSVRGKVFLPSGNVPEQRIRVILEHNAGGIVSETFSDSVGNFEFRGLANNTYRVVVPTDYHNYETAQENVELFGNFSRTVSIQIYLKEKNSGPTLTMKDKLLSPADIQEVPKPAKKLYDQGVKLARDNKHDKAVAKFQEALQVFPDYLHALNKIGEQMTALNNQEAARASFERAIAISPKFALPYLGLGILLVSQKRYDEAITALETGNRYDDTYPMGHLNLGMALMSANSPDLDRAEKELSRAIEMGKRDFLYVRKLLFNLNVRRQKYDKAAAQLEAYLREAPDAPDSQDVRLTLDKVKKAMVQRAAAKQ